MKERITWVDSAKGIGILLVFMGHLVEVSWPGMWAYSFHLPLFFFLSGYLFSVKTSFRDFLKKKAKSILLPYVTMGLVICFFDALWNTLLTTSSYHPPFLPRFLTELGWWVIQNRFATLWYLAVLFWINILMYVIVKYIRFNWLSILCVLVLLWNGVRYYETGGGPLPWNWDTVHMALPFFYVGYFIKQHPILETPFVKWSFRPLLMVALFAFNIWLLTINKKETGFGLEMYNNYYGIVPITYLCAFAGIFGTIILSSYLHWRPLTYIGKNSLVFFLLHQAVVYPMLNKIYFKLGYGSVYTSTWRFIWVVGSKIIIACIIMFIINECLTKTKLRVLLGK